METYKSKDIREKLGISKIQLSHWINMGAIKPYRDDSRRGGSHEFDKQNLIEAAICKDLADLRVPVKSMANAMKMMREDGVWDFWKEYKNYDWFLVFSSPSKLDYTNFPDMKEYFAKRDSSNFDESFTPGLLPKKALIENLEYMKATILLSLRPIFDSIGGV